MALSDGDIIAMARDANPEHDLTAMLPFLSRFAALVAARERENAPRSVRAFPIVPAGCALASMAYQWRCASTPPQSAQGWEKRHEHLHTTRQNRNLCSSAAK